MAKKNHNKKTTWWVYMIATRLDNIYTGISTDVTRRLAEHAAGGPKGAKNLKGKGPFQLMLKKRIGSKSEASRVEWAIKQLSREQKEKIIHSPAQWKLFLKQFDFSKG